MCVSPASHFCLHKPAFQTLRLCIHTGSAATTRRRLVPPVQPVQPSLPDRPEESLAVSVTRRAEHTPPHNGSPRRMGGPPCARSLLRVCPVSQVYFVFVFVFLFPQLHAQCFKGGSLHHAASHCGWRPPGVRRRAAAVPRGPQRAALGASGAEYDPDQVRVQKYKYKYKYKIYLCSRSRSSSGQGGIIVWCLWLRRVA